MFVILAAVKALAEAACVLNQAAAESKADYLLFLDAAGMVESRHFFRELIMYAQMDGVAGVMPVRFLKLRAMILYSVPSTSAA